MWVHVMRAQNGGEASQMKKTINKNRLQIPLPLTKINQCLDLLHLHT